MLLDLMMCMVNLMMMPNVLLLKCVSSVTLTHNGNAGHNDLIVLNIPITFY